MDKYQIDDNFFRIRYPLSIVLIEAFMVHFWHNNKDSMRENDSIKQLFHSRNSKNFKFLKKIK